MVLCYLKKLIMQAKSYYYLLFFVYRFQYYRAYLAMNSDTPNWSSLVTSVYDTLGTRDLPGTLAERTSGIYNYFYYF